MLLMEQQPTPAEESEYLTIDQVAKKLNAPENSVRDWIQKKRLPAYKFGRRVQIKKADLEKFIENSKM